MPAKLKHGVTGANGGKRNGAGRKSDWLKTQSQKIFKDAEALKFYKQVLKGDFFVQPSHGESETINAPASLKDRIAVAKIIKEWGWGLDNQPISGPNGEDLRFSVISYANNNHP